MGRESCQDDGARMTAETTNGYRYYKDSSGKRVPSVTTILSSYKESDGLVRWAYNLGREGKDFETERQGAANVGKMAHAMIDGWIKTGELQLPLMFEDSEVSEELTAPAVFPPFDTLEGALPPPTPPSPKTRLQLALTAFNAFRTWLDGQKITLIASEVGAIDDTRRFGGTLDAIGQTPSGDHIMLDWKSGNDVYPEVIPQVGAYAHLWESGRLLEPLKVERKSIIGLHVIRLGKEYGDFHHHYVPYSGLLLGKKAFFHCLDLYNIRKELKKLVK